MKGDTLLETLQADVLAILLNCADLADANIIPEDDGDMEKKILQKLGTLTGGGTAKPGLVIVVVLPEITEAATNLPGPPVSMQIEIRVIEQPLVNRAASGTNIRSSVAAIRVLAALQLRCLGHCALFPVPNPVKPVPIKPGYLSHSVMMAVNNVGIDPPAKCGQVTATWIDLADTLAMVCATPGSFIHYTTDGTYPTPLSNSYSTPITGLAVGTVVRAAAYAADMLPGDLTQITITA